MKRYFYIDAFRAMLILLVVIGHSVQWLDSDFDANPVFRTIYSFHMAAFMFVSGYVTWRGESFAILGKLRHLLVPFFAWWFFGSVLMSGSFDGLLDSSWGLLRQPDGGLWFLYALAWCQFLLWCICISCKWGRLALPLSVVLAVALLGVEALTQCKAYGYHLVAWYFPFFLGGCVFRAYGHKVSLSYGVRLALVILGLSVWAVGVCFWHREHAICVGGVQLPVAISFVYRFIVAWLGAVGFFMLARHMLPESGESWFAKAVTRPGRETLGI